ncbi:hypothetical protein EI42_01317 [Thermosporothrix hazakensis]|jgi:hypothetical protein|uniref:Uncharacterized protein n=2 Tax=Thermosporothrix TaxID=768650 RepID=A0A326UBK7_THEHA|nr:hypothetical protein [Thermosporothrix hazakensis]PZW34480.1 hypothetical protein EI42_01317 [Thermosporothrix hazakensis]BBH85602.1 hypothetical protein KTC_03530 [Thermosporothrix sp. COM3]GCE45970.1 hypothetical protein KTH_08390 [Thermosporothrix hazakensis]
MEKSKRIIFREVALQRYLQRQEKQVLPRLMIPLVFKFLWVALALLLLGLFLITQEIHALLGG